MKKLLLLAGILFFLGVSIFYYLKLNSPRVDMEEVAKPVEDFFIEKQEPKEQKVTIAAAGDIACDRVSTHPQECKDAETAALLDKINPNAVLIPGDLQYPSGDLEDFRQYYDKTWGRWKEKTYPAPGNHDYQARDAEGYFTYFGERAGEKGKGYYSFNLGQWHIIALNSNCWTVGGCEKNSPQGMWLKQDLEKNKKKCMLAFWHHPLFSIGRYEGYDIVKPVWEILASSNIEIIITGHDHNYQRFMKLTSEGIPSPKGIRQFVVGAGGRNIYDISREASVVQASNESFGILALTLFPESYSWKYITTNSRVVDAGEELCH